MDEPEGFREFVAARSAALVRVGWLLTGDEALAHDLVQTALVKTWTRWGRIHRREAPEAYVRRVMVSTLLTWNRRRWRGEVPVAEPPERREETDPFTAAETRQAVAVALRALPTRQRAVVVLRYFEDLTETTTAELLGCSVGTVKSQTSKALARLRTCAELRDLLRDVEVNP